AGLTTRGIATVPRPIVPMSEVTSRYYLRFSVADRPGVMGRVAGALGDAGVSIEQMVQEGRAAETADPVDVVLITHGAREGAVRTALTSIAKDSFLSAPPRFIRIEDR